jgi:hypothetical protein
MYRAQIIWSGFPGAPGFTTLYATTTDPLQAGADAFITGVNVLATSWANTLPGPTVSVQVSSEIQLIEDTTGDLVDILTATTPPAAHVGALGGNYSGPSGWCVDWLTSTVAFGKRRMGRSYVVPASTEIYQNDGTIATATLTAQRAVASTYATATAFHPCLWVRPFPGDPEATPPKPAHLGQAVALSAARVPDKSVVLRSRRD